MEYNERERAIEEILKDTALSIGSSFGSYWCSDAASRNDANESNVTIHFAHALLSRGFSAYAESDHAYRGIERIDLLGFAQTRDWFLACEFKRLWNTASLYRLLGDIVRLETFWLNPYLKRDQCGETICRNVENCAAGFGLVGGLIWKKRSKLPKPFAFWEDERKEDTAGFRRTIEGLGGRLVSPIEAWRIRRRWNLRFALWFLPDSTAKEIFNMMVFPSFGAPKTEQDE